MDRNLEHTQSHIDSMARQEQEFLEKRTLSERAGDGVAALAGSLVFVMIHVLLVLTWILINVQGVRWIPRFDSYPFSVLGMIVSVEAVVLSSFILMCERMGLKHIADDKELRESSQATSVETLTQRLEDTLPDP